MSKARIIAQIYRTCTEAELPVSKKLIGDITDQVFATAREDLVTTGRFSYPKFGSFTVKESAARAGRNPQTGEPLEIKARKRVKFSLASDLKAELNPHLKE
eukprot:TRINITY_DN2398_c0_g1_i1.p2 TRINITY_DN2398_c0_g1~~TRINITY_DN2398_c0_g1_i1.p2  ORF type:complete len:109 (-),score=29.85 TRINITY_DN2398_c0_g1_i1:281-583(-)